MSELPSGLGQFGVVWAETMREVHPETFYEMLQNGTLVREGSAFRTRVEFGLIGYDAVEITKGVQTGDEVIVSDMTNYIHARELKLK